MMMSIKWASSRKGDFLWKEILAWGKSEAKSRNLVCVLAVWPSALKVDSLQIGLGVLGTGASVLQCIYWGPLVVEPARR